MRDVEQRISIGRFSGSYRLIDDRDLSVTVSEVNLLDFRAVDEFLIELRAVAEYDNDLEAATDEARHCYISESLSSE